MDASGFSLLQAILGGTIQVPTLTGDVVVKVGLDLLCILFYLALISVLSNDKKLSISRL